MRSEHAWSLLDPKPVMVHLPDCDEYIVYWNGVVMPHAMALGMTMERLGIYSTPTMKAALEQNYNRLYYSGAFETRAWDTQVQTSDVYSYLKKIMNTHLTKLIENRKSQEILGWFDYSKARVENSSKVEC